MMNSVSARAGNGDHARQAFDSSYSQAAGETSEMKHDALFERFSARLKAQVGQDVYASWFGRLKLHSVSKSVVRLTVPTTFLKSWINNRYLDLITSIFQAEDAEILKVEILVRSASRNATAPRAASAGEERGVAAEQVSNQSFPRRDANRDTGSRDAGPREIGKIATFPTSAAAAPARQASSASPLFGSPLDSRFTFETFIEGPSNRVALAAAKTIAEAGAGAVRFNPLFIH